jgi:cellulose synthase/poly-beta-1,6-N-acetylglucosamine synthase-like glycosyltransferase
MEISIVIPVYNAQRGIADVVNACSKQEAPGNTIEVIAVDDGSTDSTAQRMKQLPARYIYQENAGPAKARNTGWKASAGEVVCFTDADCIPQNDWVKNLIDGFDSEEVGAVAGSYNIANPGKLFPQCIHEEIKIRHKQFKQYIRAFGSYNVAIKRHVLEEVGGYDEYYRSASGEDNDLSYKILRAGYKIRFQQSALVAHYHPEHFWKYLKDQYRHGYWRAKLYRDFPDMVRGDDYTTFKDIAEIPLALMTFCFIPFIWHPYGVLTLLALIGLNGLLQLKKAVDLIKMKKNFKFIYLSVVTFCRSYMRAIGFIKGMIKF